MADVHECNCGNEIIYIPGIPGPAGPQGPVGPAGPGASFPIAASNISVTNAGFSNLQQLLNYMLAGPMNINAFSTQVQTYLIGTTVNTLTFTYSLSKTPTTITISGPNLTTYTPIGSPSTANLASALNPTTVGASYAYTLTVSDNITTPTKLTAVTFLNNVYYGDANDPGSITSAFVTSLGKNIQAGKGFSFTSNASGSQYCWFACRAALGGAVFVVNGFPGGFNPPVTISVTNAAGFSENYYVYKSVNTGIGPVNVVTS